MDQYRTNNLALWNEWTRINAASSLYRLDEFRHGENKLNPLEREEVGDVHERSLLHLQCHFGMDTLSWAMLGAQVTGVDFSDAAIKLARSLSAELALPARFICCDIYDLPQHLQEQFDIVYTSYGVLSWLSDLPAWAKLAASSLKPGGTFYIAEFHPAAMMFDDGSEEVRLRYSYFDTEVLKFDVQGSYADQSAECAVDTEYNWPYTLGGVINALLGAGLELEFLHEFPFTVYQQLPYLKQVDEFYWRQPEGQPLMPLMFSIRAHKPAK
jgi:2-polyprenyl-3-methyl-5-hydroxy-6-metoxy-1,4-benzoquinol methylase